MYPEESPPLASIFAMCIASISHVNALSCARVTGAQLALGTLMAIAVGGNLPGINGENPGLQKLIFGLFGLPFGLLLV